MACKPENVLLLAGPAACWSPSCKCAAYTLPITPAPHVKIFIPYLIPAHTFRDVFTAVAGFVSFVVALIRVRWRRQELSQRFVAA